MARKTPKYKSKFVYWDIFYQHVVSQENIEAYRQQGQLKLPENIWRFDSQHEFKVYLQLVRIFGAGRIVRQYELEIIPRGLCYPSGKTWRVDFAIISQPPTGGFSHYIEAKGGILPGFAMVLACLETHNVDAFDKTYVIFTRCVSTTNRVIKALLKTPVGRRLITLKQLEQLNELP